MSFLSTQIPKNVLLIICWNITIFAHYAHFPFSKPAPPVEKKDDNLEDSEVLKMLRNSNLSDESTGLRRTGQGRRISRESDSNDEGNVSQQRII